MNDVPPWEGRFQILALDGGGIRGAFSAAVLAKLEEDLGITVRDHFDLIVGTSTGGIIAVALGMGIQPAELVDFYVDRGPHIFPGTSGWLGKSLSFLRSAFHRKYDNQSLQVALREVLGDATLGQSEKRLVIPSYNLGRDQVRLFKTPHHPRLNRDSKTKAWQVAMATSAAPTFFPVWRGIEGMRLIDGGVWANNPTMVGIIEAKSLLRVPIDQIKVFSLGTCDDLTWRSDRLDEGGFLTWRDRGVDVLMRGQSVGTHNLATLLIGDDHVFRLDPTVPAQLFSLDDTTTTDKLLAEAAHSSVCCAPVFEREFADHEASDYRPFQR